MLVATQYAWAAGAMFFCGQDYYESQEIKSEYIKSGTVYLDIVNQTFTVTNAVMNFDYWGHLMNGDSNALNLEIRPITNTNQPIQFEDQDIRSLCVNNWDTNGDGELSYAEAAAVTSLGNVFKNQPIVDFHELQYFTGLTEIGESAFNLTPYLPRDTEKSLKLQII